MADIVKDVESPIDDSIRAAQEALGRTAWSEAFDLLMAADEHEPLEPEQLMMLSEAAWWSGHADKRVDALERAYASLMSADKPRQAAMVAMQLADHAFFGLNFAISDGWTKRAERLLEGTPEDVAEGYLALLYAVVAFFGSNELDEAFGQLTRVLEIGRRYKDSELEAMALNLQGRVLIKKGEVAKGFSLIDESTAAAMAGELGPHIAGNVYCSTIDACRDLADWGRAAEWTEEADRFLRRRNITGYPGICRVHRAEIKALRGDLLEAEQEAKAACTELEQFRLMYAVGWAYNVVGEIRLRLGDLKAAEEAFQRAYEVGHEPQPGLALLLLAQGDEAAAALSIKRTLSVDERSEDRIGINANNPLGRFWLLPAQVEIALAVGDLDTARTAVEELESTASTFDSKAIEAATICARGALLLAEGDYATAVVKLSKGWRAFQQIEAPYQSARARTLLGKAYWGQGETKSALGELRAAKAVFDRLGAVPDVRTVDGLLAEYRGTGTDAGQRMLKTFMFTDLVNSTELIGVMGDDAWDELLRWHNGTLRSLFAEHKGVEVKQTGDGFFVAFDEPNQAIESAVAIQRTLASHRRDHGFAPSIRIGVHTGEATQVGSDYQGMGVHAAARIGAVAGRDEVLVSRATVEAAGTMSERVGEFKMVALKGIKEPTEVAAVTWR